MNAASTFQKGEIIGRSYETPVYLDLPPRKHKKKMYENGALKVDVMRPPKYGLQARVQNRHNEWVTEQLGNKTAICVASPSYCTCEYTIELLCAKENEKCSHYRKSLLANSRFRSVELQHSKICTEYHLVDPPRVALIANTKM